MVRKGEKKNQFGTANFGQFKEPAALVDLDMDLDEFSTCSSAFQKLKKLMDSWYNDARHFSSDLANDLMLHFYRWLTSTSCKLYDPLLHRLVHRMLKTSFQRLIQELKELGLRTVHGDFNKIIVATDKTSFANAES